MGEKFYSRVYTERPDYADYDAEMKFQAILGIIGTRLRQHPKAICSYSGGSDSDILIDIIERARDMFGLEKVDYVFFNTGLEMKATKDHVKEVAKKYGVDMRSVPKNLDFGETMCFHHTGNQYRFKPLYYVSDKDKAWYKEYYGLRYSDAYEVYGLKRTGCCGCSISSRAVEDLKLIEPYEPNVVKAAWSIFGESYKFRQRYNDFKKQKMEEAKMRSKTVYPNGEEQLKLT